MSNLSEIATAIMESDRPAVVDWHKVAASDARTAEHPDTDSNVRGAYRNTEAKTLLSAIFAYDHANQLDLSTVDRLLIAAEIAARAKGEALALPYEPAEGEGPAGILVDALAMLSCVERAECFDGATGGYFTLQDGREFRFSVDVPAETACPACEGKGAFPATGEACDDCLGGGVVIETAAKAETCKHCGEERDETAASSYLQWQCSCCSSWNDRSADELTGKAEAVQ